MRLEITTGGAPNNQLITGEPQKNRRGGRAWNYNPVPHAGPGRGIKSLPCPAPLRLRILITHLLPTAAPSIPFSCLQRSQRGGVNILCPAPAPPCPAGFSRAPPVINPLLGAPPVPFSGCIFFRVFRQKGLPPVFDRNQTHTGILYNRYLGVRLAPIEHRGGV